MRARRRTTPRAAKASEPYTKARQALACARRGLPLLSSGPAYGGPLKPNVRGLTFTLTIKTWPHPIWSKLALAC